MPQARQSLKSVMSPFPAPAHYDLTTPGAIVWALGDAQNTVRDLAEYSETAGATVVVNHRVLTAYGQVLSQTDPATLAPATVDCAFNYTGRYLDSVTHLQYNSARWYDPATGGWLGEDPDGFAAGDANLYRYVGNGTTYKVDPTGLAEGWVPPGGWGSGRPGSGGGATSGLAYDPSSPGDDYGPPAG